MNNPIIDKYEAIADLSVFENYAAVFDHCNGAAWKEAEEPDDRPGTDWWTLEDEAYRELDRRYEAATA